MSTTTTPAPVRTWWSGTDVWARTRALLVVLWILTSLAAVAVGQRHSDYRDLQDAVAAGSVREVTVVGALPPGSTGYALVEVTWRAGGTARLAEVWQIDPGADGGEATPTPGEDHPHVVGDVVRQLRTLQPDLQVDTGDRPAVYGEVLGWRVPVWLSLAVVAAALVQLIVLVRGPQPRWATRWAWFWLSWSYVGGLVFLLLSGPAPGLPAPREGARRLTGGRALVISLILGLAITSTVP